MRLARGRRVPMAGQAGAQGRVPARTIFAGTVLNYAAVIVSYVSPVTAFKFLVQSWSMYGCDLYLHALITVSWLCLWARLKWEAPNGLQMRMWAYAYPTITQLRRLSSVDNHHSSLA
jgi:L-asparagine transporter-like permease